MPRLRRAAAPRRTRRSRRRSGAIPRRATCSPCRNAGRRRIRIAAAAAGARRVACRRSAGCARVGLRFAARRSRVRLRLAAWRMSVCLRRPRRVRASAFAKRAWRTRAGLRPFGGLARRRSRGVRFRLRSGARRQTTSSLPMCWTGAASSSAQIAVEQKLALGPVVAEHADLDQLVCEQRHVDFVQEPPASVRAGRW